ncbi:MAG: PIN domain nuclease [Phycisphaerae bacterium]|nr:PIN domain nuclease [Phycisphaerae bacterium]|tara:strand:+ start:8405 stop:8809 length:405 start_codon:yes stop_codon:yes gene_type:complete
MSLIIDCSVVLAWCLADESNATADAAMEAVVDNGAVVPAIWWYEIRNALVINERRGRIDQTDTQATLADLRDLGIAIDRDHDEMGVIQIARQHQLTVYDAAYFEVAQRRAIPLCTLDRKLKDAAKNAGVGIWEA